MRLSKSQLLHLPVETRSGRQLGKIVDFVVDAASQTIVQYHVKSSTFVPGLFEQKLLVGRDEVVSLTNEKMVVEDSAVEVRSGQAKFSQGVNPSVPS
jgi:sporulation protein YlmC with PRC-barrel domain